MDAEYKVSDAVVLKAVPKDMDENPYGIEEVMSLCPGRPSIVMFGGEYTSMPLAANHYIKYMKNILAENQMQDIGVDIYSVYYIWGSRQADVERDQLFREMGRENHDLGWRSMLYRAKKLESMQQNEATPRYIDILYNTLIRPLVLDESGRRLDIKSALRNVGTVRFYAHSHGAAVVYMLGEYAAKQMRKYNYSDIEIRRIQRGIVVVQHGPTAPLEQPRFNTISFMSASDGVSNQRNIFFNQLNRYADEIQPMYINRWGMNLFVGGRFWDQDGMEHDDKGMLNAEFRHLTDDGKSVIGAERNAILNLIKSAVAGKAPQPLPQLISGEHIDFAKMSKNGCDFCKDVDLYTKLIQTRNLKHGCQR